MKFHFSDLSDADVNLIGELLDEQPYKKVASLAKRLQAQIDAQITQVKAAGEQHQKAAMAGLVDAEVAKRGLVKPNSRKRRG